MISVFEFFLSSHTDKTKSQEQQDILAKQV